MGLMVSISGYSSVAIKEASCDRTPLLLLDHNHIYAMLIGTYSFADILRRVKKKRISNRSRFSCNSRILNFGVKTKYNLRARVNRTIFEGQFEKMPHKPKAIVKKNPTIAIT